MSLQERRKREKELQAELKHGKRVENNVKRNQQRIKSGKKARSLTEAEMDREIAKSGTTAQKIKRWQSKAAEMRAKAKEVERSGTGNEKAVATYRKTAKEYLKRVTALKGK